MGLGPSELMIVGMIVLLFFGGAKLPKLARSLGEAKRELERGANGETEPAPVVASPVVVSAPATHDVA